MTKQYNLTLTEDQDKKFNEILDKLGIGAFKEGDIKAEKLRLFVEKLCGTSDLTTVITTQPKTETKTVECYYGTWIPSKNLVYCDNPRHKHRKDRYVPLEVCQRCQSRRSAVKETKGTEAEYRQRARETESEKYSRPAVYNPATGDYR